MFISQALIGESGDVKQIQLVEYRVSQLMCHNNATNQQRGLKSKKTLVVDNSFSYFAS